MAKFYYTQAVLYTLVIEADTQEQAEAIAYDTDIHAQGVMADYAGWEQDCVEE